ncbi:unnamed protein product [Rotaria socialis]
MIFATPQINLHYTINKNESYSELQHDCLRATTSAGEATITHQIISFCMSDLPSIFPIETNNRFPKFTFAELSKLNITSQQLYRWSAPIDIIEDYQYYLNQLSTSNDLSQEVFYNCTLPRFGSMCQYEIDYYDENYSSLSAMIHDYYHTYAYDPTSLTCYTHLQCNRGPFPACLDWTEICNGYRDCIDSEVDEEYCWQLEYNECKDNEYQCTNGQCIPASFFQDDIDTPDCLDGSDEVSSRTYRKGRCVKDVPLFECEDMSCEGTFLTTSCVEGRANLLLAAIFSTRDDSISKQCWSTLKCMMEIPHPESQFCDKSCYMFSCGEIINDSCPDMLYIPNSPLFFGDMFVALTKNDLLALAGGFLSTLAICYNNSRYDEYFIDDPKILFNNTTCYYPKMLSFQYGLSTTWGFKFHNPLHQFFILLRKYNVGSSDISAICNRSTMYQCNNSPRCISVTGVLDGLFDCPENDDEDIIQLYGKNLTDKLRHHFKCDVANTYIHQSLVDNGECDCALDDYYWCEDEGIDIQHVRKNISFQTTCDGFTELIPVNINERYETDETECEQWLCINIYTRCDGIWNCPKGEDEIGCNVSPILNCSSDHHMCVSPVTNQLSCLPIGKAHDGNVDCLGGTDEPLLCPANYEANFEFNFYCSSDTYMICASDEELCNGEYNCAHGNDEQFCVTNVSSNSICYSPALSLGSDVEKFLCHETKQKRKQQMKFFFLNEMNTTVDEPMKNMVNLVTSTSSIFKMSYNHESRCHRGFNLRVWLNDEKNLTNNTCLCPPSFYGEICQYQNQRVSMTIQFRALADSWSTLFAIVISLIDDSEERIVHSYEQLNYLSSRDCKIKFNIYLLYSTRPKNSTRNYTINIDIYEKVSLKYRGSFFYRILFPFLPVYRQALILDIPRNDENIQICSNLQCSHGRCIAYSNALDDDNFCQCDQGWSGKYCQTFHQNMCSSDSKHVGVTANNRSVCVCPIDKFGSRCLLVNAVCQMNNNLTCYNGGQCIPSDKYTLSSQSFHCVCRKGYTGDRCERNDTKIEFSFAKGIALSQSIFIHFIRIINNATPIRTTTLRTIPLKQDSITIYWSQQFHLVFVELLNKIYYLAAIQKSYNATTTIVRKINPVDRCQHINELFNETFVEMHIVRRMKYYHLPCQIYPSNLSCFYDNTQICLCYSFEQQHLANCFQFNHNMTFDCSGQSVCENDGQCFQDTPDCPKRAICICPLCYYGARCQFRTSGFGLSLDAILGYHILPHISLTNQPTIVKISIAVTVIFLLAGLINGVLCLITFKDKTICEVGCGLYLLGSSITSLSTMAVFALKYWILLVAQMTFIFNRLFLQIQCISLDFLLQVCLDMDQWMNACVAVERAVTMIKAARFQRKKSKKMAKLVIGSLLIFVIGTSVYDPLYRRIVEEDNEDEKRIWCIATYPARLQIFHSFINTFHFIVPFVINLISAVILITKRSRQQIYTQHQRPYKELLREQIRQHKHLFTAPVVFFILGLPRLIISFISKCMRSTNDAWLFLIAYFIPLVPPMLTYAVFVLPSKFYRKQCHKALNAYRTKIQRILQFTK